MHHFLLLDKTFTCFQDFVQYIRLLRATLFSPFNDSLLQAIPGKKFQSKRGKIKLNVIFQYIHLKKTDIISSDPCNGYIAALNSI